MGTKLTLKLDENVIKEAKKYARKKNSSLSRLVEDYFRHLTQNSLTEGNITPLVKELSGVIPVSEPVKSDYTDWLEKKYG